MLLLRRKGKCFSIFAKHCMNKGFLMLAEKILTLFIKSSMKNILKLSAFDPNEYPDAVANKEYMLYIHVPFCDGFCPYCSFNKFLYQENLARKYFIDLRDEIHYYSEAGFNFNSMYFGGGTPTILMDELCKTIDYAKSLFNIRDVSCETNPNHLSVANIELLQSRIDRLSVGVQSFNDTLLKQMGRYMRFGSGEEVFQQIFQAAKLFPSLNVDMIYNLPNQTISGLKLDIQKIIDSGTHQVTFYPLMPARSTAESILNNISKIDHTHRYEFFKLLQQDISKAFIPTTAWTYNRSDRGMIDEYIVDYSDFIGTGSGSFSYLNGKLFVNTFSLKKYHSLVSNGNSAITKMLKFNKRQQMQYEFMKSLFGLKLNKNDFQKKFLTPVEFGLWDSMLFMTLAKAFDINNNEHITLTTKGRFLSTVMMQEFFSGINNVREQARLSTEY